jgi:hypothetical protein
MFFSVQLQNLTPVVIKNATEHFTFAAEAEISRYFALPQITKSYFFMERILHYSFRIFLVLIVCPAMPSFAQTTVFSDDFSTSAGTSYTTITGAIGTSPKWGFSRSGADFGARIDGGLMTLTNDSGGTANANGWVLASTSTGGFAAPYNTTLSSNPGMVTWTFNMRQIRSNPKGFSNTYYGDAYILAGTYGTTNVSGTGYAIILGNSGSIDPIKLVRYNAGIRSNTTLLASNTAGLTDFGKQYLSIRVTFVPSTNTWQLYVRNDGITAFADPASGTLTSQGTVVNNSYTTTPMTMMGAYWNATTNASQTAFFDNVNVAVTLPSITSISPSSKTAGTGAFTLTVNGANFINGTSVVRWNGSNRPTTYVSPAQLTTSIPASDIITSGTAAITVANGTAISNMQTFTIDPAGVPTLSLSTNALGAVSTVTGTPSAALTYTISGSNLAANPIITPPVNFEISSNGSTYSSSLTLPRTGNVLTGQPVTLYSRIKATAPAGIYSGDISHTVTGGTTKLVSVSGTVLSSQPGTQASAVSFANVTSSSFTVSFTSGNGSNRLVLIKSGSAVNSAPMDGTTYAAMAAFGAGAEIGTGNFVAYSGTGNTVNIIGLSAATTYYVAVYEFNGSAGTQNYLTTSPPTGSKLTLNAPVGWQIYTANTVNTIDFDDTVDGVNNDTFQGDGFSPTPETGELNSKAWAITGFSDGAVPFSGTSNEDEDFDRSVADGSVDVGGIYAFETSTDNFSLGIQPAANDFAPGSVTLRFQNETGGTINSINLAYRVYVYNDEAGSSSFNFSHSADNNTYANVSGINVVSPAAADIVPGWKAYYRVVTLTGLSIPNNNYYYFRWSGAAVSGSTDFDQFGLDDIRLVANPTSVFVPTSGTAESFVVLGNTVLSGDTTILSDLTFNGGKLDINGKTLILAGTVTNTVAGGLKGSASSNLTIGGAVGPTLSFDQTTPGTTNLLNNLSILTTASNTTNVSNSLMVNGALVTRTGQILNFGTNSLTGTLASVMNNGTIFTQNTSATPLPAGKIWGGTGTVNYNAATAQIAVAGTYQGLTISNTGAAVAGGDITVNGILDLPLPNASATVGGLSMGSYTLTMGGSATNTGIGDVTGIVTRNSILPNVLYTFGHAHTSILFPAAGTLPTSMSLRIKMGTEPSWKPGAIMREFDFIQTGGSMTKAVIKAHYLDSELNSNNEAKLVDWAYKVAPGEFLEQGRSNFNTVENWIELTNVNVGQYFQPAFDAIKLTLDESIANSLVWNGSVSTSWTTVENWTPNATPSDDTIVYIPNAENTPNDPMLNPLVLLGSLNIEAGGILNSDIGSQFTLKRGAGAWINAGTFNAGNSTVIFTSPDATIAGTTNFNNVTVKADAGLRPVTGNVMRIYGQFINNGTLYTGAIQNTVEYNGTNQVIASPNGELSAYHDLVINGTGATFPTVLNITGDLVLNQSVDFTGKTIALNSADSQTIGGSASPVFNNLTINNFGQVDLINDTAITGTLTLTAGNLNIGNKILTLGSNAVSGFFDNTKMIIVNETGEVRRSFTSAGSYFFPIGELTGVKDYAPITVNVTSGTFAIGYVGVSVVDVVHPNNFSAENNLSRYWKVNQSGITDAMATITAGYKAGDLASAENSIAAAQLNGAFSQQTNPWVKFAALGSNTLTAAGATLTSGQTSYFTGIKGGAFSVLLSGYGSFCKNEAVTLAATPSGGNAPYTYSWSNGLGTSDTATPLTDTVGTTNYTVTVKDSNGITATDNNNVVVLTPSVGGSLSASQVLCSGSIADDITLSNHIGAVAYWQSATDVGFTNPVNISNTTSVLGGMEIGPVTQTTYVRAVIQNGSCSEVFSAVTVIDLKSTTWNGSAWSNGIPDSVTAVFITGNYSFAGNLNACTMKVSNNAAVVISSGYNVFLNGTLRVEPGSSFTLENNANLLQSSNAANYGNIVVKRNSSAIRRQDYTLWSSPVEEQKLLAFSPLTVVSPTSRFYQYKTDLNAYSSITTPGTVDFNPAQGYLIRVANNHPTFQWIWNGQFTGKPHNGNYSYTMYNGGPGLRYNLVGNPYPSPISARAFLLQNRTKVTQQLYFWRETNNNTDNNAYCTWSSAGGENGTFVGNTQSAVFNPNGVIQTGQGFFVEALDDATVVDFNNSMRVANNANQFFRTSSEMAMVPYESHRIWLNVTNVGGAFCQTAFGYMTGATNGIDLGIDGTYMNTGQTELYTLIGTSKLVIQGRALAFDAADIVVLGFKATTAGNYTIAIDHVDGLFTGSQDIFLKDNLTGAQHNLKGGAYTFSSDAGVFDTRFEIIYKPGLELGTDGSVFENEIVVYKQHAGFAINSGKVIMDNVKVFDIMGRLLVEKQNVNSAETTFNAGDANQVLIVKITTDDNRSITKEIVN